MVWVWIGLVAGVLALLGGLAWLARSQPAAQAGAEHPPGRPLPTRAGIWVASKGEQRIANWLTAQGIAFAYEPEIAGGLTPDFRIEETHVVIEYWGLAGEPGYEDRMEEKMEIYTEHGFDVVGLFPTHVHEMGDVLERELAKRGVLDAGSG